ncbi:glycosyltransferase [Aquimarina macrocephali]|uniref:glycosyltransferase n=1 Tax=Aquimarina macrocephali TaxID=666563 RepID=UPI000466489C|nr:glycosyltransferase [Aquimarina macrocephali]
MKILLISIGTRGDIEPFLAIGQLLYKKGHEIIFSFPEQHSKLVSNEFKFFPLSPKFIELIESEDGKIMMGGKMRLNSKIKALYNLYKKGKYVNKLLVKQQYEIIEKEKPYRIIYNSKCNYPLIWSIENSMKSVMISPVPYVIHYVEGNAHIGFNGNYGKLINRLTYRLAIFGLVKMIKDASNNIPEKISLSKRKIKKALFAENLIFTISPTLFLNPKDWPSNVQILGYHKQDKKVDWKPEKELIAFLANNKRVVFLSFGSMVNPNPEKTSRLLLKTLNKLQIPTVINTASGGIIKLSEFANNELFHFVTSIPYEWIFKRTYGVIHHGGSGTTHMGLKNGCATLIIPHIIDQFGWNSMIKSIGAGPKGPSIGKLSIKTIEPLLIDLVTKESYKSKAEKISHKMNSENLKEELYEFIMA